MCIFYCILWSICNTKIKFLHLVSCQWIQTKHTKGTLSVDLSQPMSIMLDSSTVVAFYIVLLLFRVFRPNKSTSETDMLYLKSFDEIRIRIYLLACRNLLWDILRLLSGRRAGLGLYVILTLWWARGANQPPYALLYRSWCWNKNALGCVIGKGWWGNLERYFIINGP